MENVFNMIEHVEKEVEGEGSNVRNYNLETKTLLKRVHKGTGGFKDIMLFRNLNKVVVRGDLAEVWIYDIDRENDKPFVYEFGGNATSFERWSEDTFIISGTKGIFSVFNVRMNKIVFSLSLTGIEGIGTQSDVLKFLRISQEELFLALVKSSGIKFKDVILSMPSEKLMRQLTLRELDCDTKFVMSKSLPNCFIYNFYESQKATVLHDFANDKELKIFKNPSSIVVYSLDSFLSEKTNEEFILVGGICDQTFVHNVQTGDCVRSLKTNFASWCSHLLLNRYYIYGSSRKDIQILDCQDDFHDVYSRLCGNMQHEGIHGIRLFRGSSSKSVIVGYVTMGELEVFEISGDNIHVPDDGSKEAQKDLEERIEYVRNESDVFLEGNDDKNGCVIRLEGKSDMMFSKLFLLL